MSRYRSLAPLGASVGCVAWYSPQRRDKLHLTRRPSYAQCQATDWGSTGLVLQMQRYDRLAAKLWNATRPGVVTERHAPTQTKVIRVVLTGGPCAGKSSCLAHLRETATEAGYDVYLVPEVATVFLNNGVDFPDNPDAIFNFQHQILCQQLALERSFTSIAASTGRPSILIMDRGLLDGKSYVSDAAWQKLLNATEASEPGIDKPRQQMSEGYALKRYDLVVHLVTAADGAEEHYKWGQTVDTSGNQVFRGEPAEKARELDLRLRSVWSVHPNHVIIRNDSAGMEGKMKNCTAAILNCANTLQPQPKFLKERVQQLEKEVVELKRLLQTSECPPSN